MKNQISKIIKVELNQNTRKTKLNPTEKQAAVRIIKGHGDGCGVLKL